MLLFTTHHMVRILLVFLVLLIGCSPIGQEDAYPAQGDPFGYTQPAELYFRNLRFHQYASNSGQSIKPDTLIPKDLMASNSSGIVPIILLNKLQSS